MSGSASIARSRSFRSFRSFRSVRTGRGSRCARGDQRGSATAGANTSAVQSPMTFDAASWSLLLGVVAFTAACSGDDDSAEVPVDSALVESTLIADDSTAGATGAADASGDGITDSAESVVGDDTTVIVTTDVAATRTTAVTAVPSTNDSATVGRPEDTASAGGNSGSVTWVDPTDQFSVAFPGEPTATEIPVPDVSNGATLTAYIYETTEAAFLANRTDSTEIDESVTDVSLQDAVTGSMAFVGGTVGREEVTTIQGRDAIRFDFTVAGGVGEGLTIGDGLVLYQLLGIGELSSQPELAAFVDSFSFTEDQ